MSLLSLVLFSAWLTESAGLSLALGAFLAILLDQRRAKVDAVRSRFLILTGVSALLGLLGSLTAVYLFSFGIVRRVKVLEHNAERLARGEELQELPDEADERRRLRRGFTPGEVEAETACGGKLPLRRAIRVRVRYFIDGGALGSAAFVERVFERHRGRFGLKRRTGARRMREADWEGLCVLRDLKNDRIGPGSK